MAAEPVGPPNGWILSRGWEASEPWAGGGGCTGAVVGVVVVVVVVVPDVVGVVVVVPDVVVPDVVVPDVVGVVVPDVVGVVPDVGVVVGDVAVGSGELVDAPDELAPEFVVAAAPAVAVPLADEPEVAVAAGLVGGAVAPTAVETTRAIRAAVTATGTITRRLIDPVKTV
jgi:hypothetical protein